MPSTTRSQGTSDLPAANERARSESPLRPRIFYVSYDGVQEPLGRSQVLAYLVRLSRDYDVTLISFEKSLDNSAAVEAELAGAGIRWMPMRYHRRPRVLSTTLDVVAGRRALVTAAKNHGPAIVHARSDVPALMAHLARHATGGKLLFDIRGFWADERVDGGIWKRGGVLHRIARRFERKFFAEADAIVTLTNASLPVIREWTGHRDVPVEVIPTCVDLKQFGGRPARLDGPHAIWTGSVGTWYRFDLVPRIAEALGLPLTVITLQTELAKRALGSYPASVRSAEPAEVPRELFAGDIGLCLIASKFSKIASAPTRFAEYLAAGMPVLVTPGVGDLENLVERYRVGTVLAGEEPAAIEDAVARLRELQADPGLSERCRLLAAESFDVERGAFRYAALYRRMLGRQSAG